MAIDLKHMLKVYNYVNDDKKPKVNLKFLGVFAALAVAIGALVVFSVQIQPSSQSSDQYATKSEYVGLSATEVAAGLPSSVAEARLAQWKLDHVDAELVNAEPVYDGAKLIGYNVTFRE
jgi:hypothetical protein